MKKYKKLSSSPWVLVVPLVIAIIVVIGAAVLSRTTTQTKSKATAKTPTEQCLTFCDRPAVIKNAAACKLDCPQVIEEEKTCDNFCQENFKGVSIKDKKALYDKNGNIIREEIEGGTVSIAVCKNKCDGWLSE